MQEGQVEVVRQTNFLWDVLEDLIIGENKQEISHCGCNRFLFLLILFNNAINIFQLNSKIGKFVKRTLY